MVFFSDIVVLVKLVGFDVWIVVGCGLVFDSLIWMVFDVL